MAILDNLAKAAKDFFVEPGGEAPAAAAPRVAVPLASPTPPLAGLPTGATQPEQRHLEHIAQVLAGDGKDFGAFVKMVKSLAASGLSGPLLYQTAFNAFAAVTSTDLPTLLTSADALAQKLADDRAQVLARHREKMGESGPPGKPGTLAQLREQETRLQAAVVSLTQQLTEQSQQLTDTQQQLHQETAKTQAALASYELANAAAVAELQAHQQAAKSLVTK
jgi:hypothetical protein